MNKISSKLLLEKIQSLLKELENDKEESGKKEEKI